MPAQSDLEALYVKGARVWIPDAETVWRPCKLAENLDPESDHVNVIFEREDDAGSDSEDDDDEYNVHKFNLKKNGKPHLRNPDVLLAENDLTALSFLHEPAVLNSLKERFVHREQVYTYCGIVLVAINPYQACPIYDNDFIELYSTRDNAELDPHIYSIANSAFTNMTRFGKNQSIIVTGESGAGKTVSAKFSMKFFAQLVAAAQTDPQLASLHLKEVTDFTYLTAGECLEVDNVDDAKEFSETQYALTLLGVGSKEQSLILRVLAAILHIGNIEMTESGNDSASLDPAEKSLGIVCTLMGVESSQLCQWLIHRRIQTVTDVFDKPLRLEEAISARDSLAKFIYAKLFEMIVGQVNEALKTKSKSANSIGVLDIYGDSAAFCSWIPGRWTYKDFRTRYRVLLRGKEPKMEPRKACEAMLTRLIPDEDKYAFGKTKIFFRAGQVALMEKWRIDRLNHSAAIIQKFIKMFIYRRQYLKKRAIAIKLQTAARAFLARKQLQELREQAAATKIQSWWMMTKARIMYEKLRRGTVYVQSLVRKKFAMQAAFGLKREQAATLIQSVWRMYQARKLFVLNIRRIVRIQCLWRVKVARRRYRILRAEARDVNKMKSLNKGLENKIMELKRKSDDKAAKIKELEEKLAKADKSSELSDEKAAEIVAQLGQVSNQRDDLVKESAEKDVRIQELEALLEEANRQTMAAKNQLEQTQKVKIELEAESDQLRQRAKTLDDDLLRLRSESEIKVNEYRRQASQGTSDGAAELLSSQLMEKEQELNTLNQRYANLNDELQITRNRQADQMVEVTAKYDTLQVELAHVKAENEKLNGELTALTDAAQEGGGADVVMIRKNELLMKDLESMKEAQLAEQQKQAERKSRMRSTEMNTDEIDMTLLETLKAEMMNKQLDLDETKEKLYGQEMGSSEQVSSLMGEISRLTNTNERLEKLCRKLNKKLRSAEKKANEFATQAGHSGSPLFPSSPSVRSFDDSQDQDDISVSDYDTRNSASPSAPQTSARSWFGLGGSKSAISTKVEIDRQPKKASDGILVFQARDLGSVVNAILESGNKIGSPRCGAAFLLFMALRHTDASNDDAMLKELLIAIINGLKRMGKRHNRSLPGIAQWTCVAIRFTHLIYQYSGEADSSLMNDAQQNSHCLKNFDINEFRGFFSETATTLYKNTISLLQEKLKPLVVSAMLDHDSLHGSDSGKSIERTGHTPLPRPSYSISDLIRELGTSLDLIASFGADDVVIKQICRQLIYYIVSIALNQLCARRDLCNWTKAMQLRYNVSQIEEYLSRREMRDKHMLKELSPLVQASQLMQVKKQDEKDADNLLAMCESLTGAQVLKLLQLITPVHEYEERVPSKFLAIIKAKIAKNPGVIQRDLNYVAQPEFPYVPSSVKLNEIDVPSEIRKHTQLV
ncbi:Oidioi.mRNA.OKI2018_I69.chr2.g5138.t1.cds [Oikopleura dioica]|uniref:Oidioi.mRNA.OKI2018_I69.chr2.g5138.t1.cds n=1 Tax=Oikopleura dioica TaxID=34765 RepID=A0ABN7SZ22_OIKDI|nr:Oidioi.mRNA.OKI2018_I69.chr2.g5138.t1.cds [Oikopleura dioica]